MRNKALRIIFPDRGAAASSSQAHLPVQSTGAATPASLVQAFSQIALPGTGNSGTGIEALTTSVGSSSSGIGYEIFDTVSKNLDRLRAVTESQVTETQANTSALSTNTAAKGASQTLSAVSSATGGLFAGLSAIPLVSGLLQLFGGGSSSTPKQTPLTKYTPPATLAFDNAAQRESDVGNLQHASYDRFGNQRINAPETPSVPDYSSLVAMVRSGTEGTAGVTSSGPATTTSPGDISAVNSSVAATNHVTVNIQAMDSRSFLDRSQDIAQAVREAMLNMHSINDVVNDL